MERKNDRLPIFTERFRELQGARSNTEFAEFLGISRQTVGFYWNGDRVPDAITLIKIAKKCEVSADWLLGLSNEKEMNGDLAQAARYTGLPAKSIEILHQLSVSSAAHLKSMLFVIEKILNYRVDDFVTWAWRAAMSSCAVDADKLAATRHNADVHLVEIANDESGEITTSVEVPLSDYEYICTSTAIGIIHNAADEALLDFKGQFRIAVQAEKATAKNRPRRSQHQGRQ